MSIRADEAAIRSDTAVFADARRRLDGCPTVPSTVLVHVRDGIVLLTGVVRRASERADAERAIRPAIAGRQLENRIAVIPPLTADDFDAPEAR